MDTHKKNSAAFGNPVPDQITQQKNQPMQAQYDLPNI
jgi:hypothetical protein